MTAVLTTYRDQFIEFAKSALAKALISDTRRSAWPVVKSVTIDDIIRGILYNHLHGTGFNSDLAFHIAGLLGYTIPSEVVNAIRKSQAALTRNP